MNQYPLFNITISTTTIRELEENLINILNNNSDSNLIVTFNLDFLRFTTFDSKFFEICKNSYLNLPDGYGITKLIKKKYNEKINRITGNDIFPLLLKIAKTNNNKIAIIGGTKLVSKKTEQLLLNQYKFQSQNLLCISPKYKFEKDKKLNEKIIDIITLFQPDIVLAALGCPRQEKWLFENMNTFESKINIGIGATLDFFTGAKKRSPVFLQNLGLEWLWRLLQEPKRLFNRYILKDLPFFLKIYFSKKF